MVVTAKESLKNVVLEEVIVLALLLFQIVQGFTLRIHKFWGASKNAEIFLIFFQSYWNLILCFKHTRDVRDLKKIPSLYR